jgi:hypothetical protein
MNISPGIRSLSFVIAVLTMAPAVAQNRESDILGQNSYDLSHAGQTFLLNEAQRVDFFMLGELHGDRQIPQLLTSLWPQFYRNGYKHIAAEVSDWAAAKLEFPTRYDSLKVEGLWTNREAQFIHSMAGKTNTKIVWGCDMEEISLGEMMMDFFQKNGAQKKVGEIQNVTAGQYNRKLAPNVLTLLGTRAYEEFRNNERYQSIIMSLRIDSARAFEQSRRKAQVLREEFMKRSFMNNYNADPTAKVLLRFGRNHLHYGLDGRGISTLGNFVSEFSVLKNLKCFNVAAFGAGGECKLMGNTFSADERSDDPAFQFLSERATYDATIFDLRPLRIYLHTIALEERSVIQQRLLYWADSYDAIICFKSVTPR